MLEVVIVCCDMVQTELCAEMLINLSTSSVIYTPDVYFADDDYKNFYEKQIIVAPKKL